MGRLWMQMGLVGGGGGVAGSAIPGNYATYTVTTTAAATHTINSLGVSESVHVDWGDGSGNDYTGTAQRTHNYAGAGTWTVTLGPATAITAFDIRDNKITLNSADVRAMVNVATFIATTLKAGRFNSVDVSAWRPTIFYLLSMPAGYAGTFNSVDVAAWRPTNFQLSYMLTGYAGTFNSVDVAAWRPTTFYLSSMPTGYAGTFNSADVSAWRPTNFQLFSMPTGYAGTFNSVDVAAWRPTTFQLFSMPTGYAGTFNSADVSAWRPTNFYLSSMPTATYIFTSGGGWANWATTTLFRVDGNGLAQATVDAILWELYQATLARTVTAGTINVGGTNAAPSGTFQAAASCPVTVATSGKEIAHELLNDGCNAIAAGETWATVTYTA